MFQPGDFSGIDLKAALKIAKRRGCNVKMPKRTGEVIVSHKRLSRSIRVNYRRKDCPRALTTALKKLLRPH